MNTASPEPPAGTVNPIAELPFPIRVARVRHDLNNPITHIVGFGEMLLEEVKEEGRDDLRPDLELINRTASQMVAQSNSSLNPVKIEAGLAHLSQLQERLHEAAEQILAAVERLTQATPKPNDVFLADLTRITGGAKAVCERSRTLFPLLVPGTDPINPLAELLQPTAEASTGVVAQKEGDILVVDDLEENRQLLTRRLSRLGYSVQVTESGARALDLAATTPVDVILLDIMMPGLDGFEVLQRLKKNPATQHIPVLMLSSADEIDTVVRCIQLGAEDFLPKPFNTTLLMARIESSLSRKRLRDQENAFLKRLQIEQDKSERLLLNILPGPVAERLKHGEKNIADSFHDVTVLFSDFEGFTRQSAKLSPADLVSRLNEVFSAFDQLCEEHNLEKIKMIGDGYMVVGGVPTERNDHVAAIADLALAMHREVVRFKSAKGPTLRMRIGINTGPVVAGVIGTKKFAYDLWGDTVNLASRMENHAPTDGTLVTTSTYERLKDKYEFEPGQLVRVKGKGEVMSYRLIGKLHH